MSFAHLLRPLDIGVIVLKNRVVFGSLPMGFGNDKTGLTNLAAFYAERAHGGCGLIIGSGVSPDYFGRLSVDTDILNSEKKVPLHRIVTNAVHKEGGAICLHVAHAGRRARHPFVVAPSAIQGDAEPQPPCVMPSWLIEQTIRHFVFCAELAQYSGYDGIEINGADGYLLEQFMSSRSNFRNDDWGGSASNRFRLPIAIVTRIREAVGPHFLIIYKLPVLQLVERGCPWGEIAGLANLLKSAGVNVLNAVVGCPDSAVPTDTGQVPEGAFRWVFKKLKGAVPLPLITSDHITSPEVAEAMLSEGAADLVSLPRALLADPNWQAKVATGALSKINPCISCLQGCKEQPISCLVNPFLFTGMNLPANEAPVKKNIAVVGAGVAGLVCATLAAQRGHSVTLFEKSSDIGGQFSVAASVPGKQDFMRAIQYYRMQLEATGVHLRLSTEASAMLLQEEGFQEVVICTGTKPELPPMSGWDHPKVMTTKQVFEGSGTVGRVVAILGSSAECLDIALFLSQTKELADAQQRYLKQWGIDQTLQARGGIHPAGIETFNAPHEHQICIFSPSKAVPLSTAVHKELLQYGVQFEFDALPLAVDDEGLTLKLQGEDFLIKVDTVVACTPHRWVDDLAHDLQGMKARVHIIGGTGNPASWNAKQAIEEGAQLALKL